MERNVAISKEPTIRVVSFICFRSRPLSPSTRKPMILQVVELRVIRVLILSSETRIENSTSHMYCRNMKMNTEMQYAPIDTIRDPDVISRGMIRATGMPR